MGHVIEHIALETQTLAGMDVGFWEEQEVMAKKAFTASSLHTWKKSRSFAAKSAVKIAEALIEGSEYDLEADIQEMRELREGERLGPSTGSIIEEAESRGIPWLRLNRYSLCQLGYGKNQKRIQATVTSETSSIAVEIACDKEDTKHLLEQAEVPVPKGEIVRSEAGLKRSR